MRKEWLGVLLALGVAGAFSACEDDNNGTSTSSNNTSSTKASSSTGQAGSPQGGNGGEPPAGGDGGTAGMGGSNGGAGGTGGGMGGAGGCIMGPPPMGNIGMCGGIAVTSGGNMVCDLYCDDQSANTYWVECDTATSTCTCKYNNQVYCTCNSPTADCNNNCCPPPWDMLSFSGAGGGPSSSVTSVGGGTSQVATSSGITVAASTGN